MGGETSLDATRKGDLPALLDFKGRSKPPDAKCLQPPTDGGDEGLRDIQTLRYAINKSEVEIRQGVRGQEKMTVKCAGEEAIAMRLVTYAAHIHTEALRRISTFTHALDLAFYTFNYVKHVGVKQESLCRM